MSQLRNINHMLNSIHNGINKYLKEVIDNPTTEEKLTRSVVDRLQENFESIFNDCNVEVLYPSDNTNYVCQFKILKDNKIEKVFYLSLDGQNYTLTEMNLSDQMKGLLNNIREKENICVQ